MCLRYVPDTILSCARSTVNPPSKPTLAGSVRVLSSASSSSFSFEYNSDCASMCAALVRLSADVLVVAELRIAFDAFDD